MPCRSLPRLPQKVPVEQGDAGACIHSASLTRLIKGQSAREGVADEWTLQRANEEELSRVKIETNEETVIHGPNPCRGSRPESLVCIG